MCFTVNVRNKLLLLIFFCNILITHQKLYYSVRDLGANLVMDGIYLHLGRVIFIWGVTGHMMS